MGSMLVWKEAEEGQVPRWEKRGQAFAANASLRVRKRGREQVAGMGGGSRSESGCVPEVDLTGVTQKTKQSRLKSQSNHSPPPSHTDNSDCPATAPSSDADEKMHGPVR